MKQVQKIATLDNNIECDCCNSKTKLLAEYFLVIINFKSHSDFHVVILNRIVIFKRMDDEQRQL